jgi:hypothetical protein
MLRATLNPTGTTHMKRLALIASIAVATLATPAVAAAATEYEGIVVSVNRDTARSACTTPSAARSASR